MGAKATKSPSNSEVSGKPHSLLRRIWEDDGPEGPRPLGLFGLVGRYKASTHQTHSRLVTTQLVFKTSVYVLCAPTDCKPPPHLEYRERRLSTLATKSRHILLLPPWVDLGCILPGIPSTAVSLLPFILTFNSSRHWQLRSEWDEEEAGMKTFKTSLAHPDIEIYGCFFTSSASSLWTEKSELMILHSVFSDYDKWERAESIWVQGEHDSPWRMYPQPSSLLNIECQLG